MKNWWYLAPKWDSSIDEKSRLIIPVKLAEELFGQRKEKEVKIYFGVDENGGHILMSTEKKSKLPLGNSITLNKNNCRVMIPPQLRKTNSFYYGRKIILVYQSEKNVVEIWPRY